MAGERSVVGALAGAGSGAGVPGLLGLGPRVGLTGPRLARAAGLLERRGWPALASGRTTPGLRTVTVVAAASSGARVGRALPALVLGSSLFLQAHLLLGYALGPGCGPGHGRGRAEQPRPAAGSPVGERSRSGN